MADDSITAALGPPHHTAYVVESIAATVERFVAEFGAGPFTLIEAVPLENVRSGGEPAVFEHNSAFGSMGGYPIELIEVARVEPELVEARFSGSLPRVHHVGFGVERERADEVRAGLEERGLAAYLTSELGEGRGSFHDASATLGHDIEIQDDIPAFRGFFEMVLGSAEGWDGSDPLRPPPG